MFIGLGARTDLILLTLILTLALYTRMSKHKVKAWGKEGTPSNNCWRGLPGLILVSNALEGALHLKHLFLRHARLPPKFTVSHIHIN